MTRAEAAILRTLLYADIFQFAMTPAELHQYLIYDEPLDLQSIRRTLHQSTQLQALLCQQEGYIALAKHAHYIDIRGKRDDIYERKWAQVVRFGKVLASIPFVRMVALTGAVAVKNPAHGGDDLDFMLMTQPGRVWLARALSIVIVRLARLSGVELCPNYVVSTDHLPQQRRDIYIAHEVVQMLPLYGYAWYQRFRAANAWTYDYLPNAADLPEQDTLCPHVLVKRLGEWLLGGWLGDRLEQWEQARKKRKFAPRIKTGASAAEIDADTVKGHFQDHGAQVVAAYHKRLAAYGLVSEGQQKSPIAGD